jgi:hypothetical protein
MIGAACLEMEKPVISVFESAKSIEQNSQGENLS